VRQASELIQNRQLVAVAQQSVPPATALPPDVRQGYALP
jgi:hypothetical protein